MKIADFLLDLIFPNRCPFCDKIIEWNRPYCEECFEEIEYTNDDNCSKCGQSPCSCQYKNGKRVFPYYDTCTSVAYYTSSVRDLILNFKYRDNPNISKLIAKMIYEVIENNEYNSPLIVAVPMLAKDKKVRGYNQAELIAKELSKQTGFELIKNNLIKVKNTSSQKKLTEVQRRKNLIKAFEVKNKEVFKDREVILVDDVITTGATLSECSKILKRAGAIKVDAVVFASTSFYS